jgi:hypothetical protein
MLEHPPFFEVQPILWMVLTEKIMD